MGNKLQKLVEVLFRKRMILNITDFKARRNRGNLNWAPIVKKKQLRTGGSGQGRKAFIHYRFNSSDWSLGCYDMGKWNTHWRA